MRADSLVSSGTESEALGDDHDRVRALMAQIETLLHGPTPVDLTHLMRLRWTLLRTLIQHLGREGAACARLLHDEPCPGAAMIADCFADELRGIWSGYLDHLILCDEPAALATDAYRDRFAALSRVLHDRMIREERWLHPLIDRHPSG